MPLQPLPMTKGLISCVDPQEIGTPEVATYYRNLLKNDAGSEVDRPGLSDFANIGSYAVLGLYYFKPADCVVAVTNEGTDARKVWKITEAGVVTDITGTALAGSSRPVFASDGTYLAIAGGGAPLQWDGSTTTTALVGSPPSCSHISYLDGYWLTHLLDDQEFRWAGPTPVARATWSAGNFFSAEGLPDNVKAQAVLQRELYAFGAETTEIFQNFGTASAPFSRTFFLESGTLSPYSVIKADNTLFWLDQNRDIVRMEGRTPVIKSEDIAGDLLGMTDVTDCFASHIKLGKAHHLITWTFPTDERTVCYDYKRGIWCEWDTLIDGLSDRLSINSHVYIDAWNKHLVGDPAIGKVYELSLDTKTDGDYPLRRIRRMTYDWGTSARKKSNYYLFDVRRGVATSTVTDPVFQVRVNDDNKGWSEPKLIPLGAAGSVASPIRVRFGGIYRKRQLEIQMTDAVDFVLKGISEDTDLMAS